MEIKNFYPGYEPEEINLIHLSKRYNTFVTINETCKVNVDLEKLSFLKTSNFINVRKLAIININNIKDIGNNYIVFKNGFQFGLGKNHIAPVRRAVKNRHILPNDIV